ncbi:TetR family transcriptional regulator [Azorhizobium oxalatiphilum]|uniref:TetR family transcriptional regulator n=1 Tax=Azorhizobium oxalatiphilum TaxID=980631 RepID=A0A917BT74_9HYPH|nr:TetR/AcrR family transcriptional regulator [Azorhizobium oxalatiphilum]GGF55934.1 TetR family transcriptional regulator [Azorhizobium oxalatiphilum]
MEATEKKVARLATPGLRPGGRSARVQASVHAAVQALLAEHDRAELSVPQVAALAGVTPSTIYRRWGDLNELLADVAVERLRPETEPADTGGLRSDLESWLEQYREEMSSEPGRAMLRDVLASLGSAIGAAQCCAFSRQQLAVIAARAKTRGDVVPDLDAMVEVCLAPILYGILFDATIMDEGFVRRLVDRLLTPAP